MGSGEKHDCPGVAEQVAARTVGKCRHFTGLPLIDLNPPLCKAGIDYDTVRDETVRPYRWPCMSLDAATVCQKVDRYTQAEAEQRGREVEARLLERAERRSNGLCPTCGESMRERQVGKCVYADPCGHRIGQGEVSHG